LQPQAAKESPGIYKKRPHKPKTIINIEFIWNPKTKNAIFERKAFILQNKTY